MIEQNIDIQQAKMKDLKTIVSLLRLNIGTFLEIEIPEAEKNIREIISKRTGKTISLLQESQT